MKAGDIVTTPAGVEWRVLATPKTGEPTEPIKCRNTKTGFVAYYLRGDLKEGEQK